jgi:type IV fimbrial biogenesis protein FimT
MKQSNRGFTLLELIISLSVIVLLVTVALPNFQGIMQRNRVTTKLNEILTAMNLARSEAITGGVVAGACPSLDGVACDADRWDVGWIVWVDDNANSAFDANEVARVNNLAAAASDGQLQVFAQNNIRNGISFSPLGTPIQGASFLLLRERNLGVNVHIHVSPAGRLESHCFPRAASCKQF